MSDEPPGGPAKTWFLVFGTIVVGSIVVATLASVASALGDPPPQWLGEAVGVTVGVMLPPGVLGTMVFGLVWLIRRDSASRRRDADVHMHDQMQAAGAPPGWYLDPHVRATMRYFDGQHWTPQTTPWGR